MFYFLLLLLSSFGVFADLSTDSSLFPDESGAGETNPNLFSNDELLTLLFEGISSLDLYSNDESLASLPGSDTETLPNEDFGKSNDLFPPVGSDLGSSISNDNVEISTNGCSSVSPLSRRTRKRTDECGTGILGSLGNPSLGNPSLEQPTIDSTSDWAQEALEKKWCSETSGSLVFGNVPVCAVDPLPVTGLFENVNGYLCKYIVEIHVPRIATVSSATDQPSYVACGLP